MIEFLLDPDNLVLVALFVAGAVMMSFTALTLLTPKYNMVVSLILFVPLWTALVVFRLYLAEGAANQSAMAILIAVNSILSIFLYLIFVAITCKERFFKKVLITLMLIAISGLAEFCAFNILSISLGGAFDLRHDTYGNVGPLVALIMQVMFFSSLIMFWKRSKIETRDDKVSFGLFLMMPLSQFLIVLGTTMTTIRYGYSFSYFVFTGALIGFTANLVLLRILFSNTEKKALESRLLKLEQIHEMERARFESIETRQYELAKVRHDFNNQLITAYRLVEQKKHAEAAGMLDALTNELEDTKENFYCANNVVNAVLDEKQTACEMAGVTLDVNIVLSEDCGIDALHLCSVFSNLLDNALNACQNIPDGVITLTALRKGDYLHIKCINPSPKNGSTRTGSGYGTRILSDIAEQYDGSYSVENSNGHYSALISLTCSD